MMAYSELETVWGSSWDRSTEELRQTMIAYADILKDDRRESWIALLKQGFGENFDREYPLQPLAEENQKTSEPQRNLSDEDRLPRENSMLSLGNFVEQVAGQKQHEVLMVESSKESPLSKSVEHLLDNPSQEAQTPENFIEKDLDMSFQKSIEHVVCEPSQRVSSNSWVSKYRCTRQCQFLERFWVKRQFHRARLKIRMKHDYRSLVTPFRHFQPPESQLNFENDGLNMVKLTLVQENRHARGHRTLFKQRYPKVQIKRSKKDPTTKTRSRCNMIYAVKKGKETQSLISRVITKDVSHDLFLKSVVGVSHMYVGVSVDKEQPNSLSQIRCVWEPGGISAIKVHWNWLDEFSSCDRAIKLIQRVHKGGFKGASCEFSYVVEKATQTEGLLSCCLVNTISMSHKMLTVFEGVGSQQIPSLNELLVGYKKKKGDKRLKLPFGLNVDCEKLLDWSHFCLCENKIRTRIYRLKIYGCECNKKMMLLIYHGLEVHKNSGFKELISVLWDIYGGAIGGANAKHELSNRHVSKHVTEDENDTFGFINPDYKGCLLIGLNVAEFLGCKTLGEEILVTGQKMQRSHDMFLNCGSCENQSPVSKHTGSKRRIYYLEKACRKLNFEALASLLQNKRCLSFHFQDKVKLSEVRNGKYGVRVCDKYKKVLVMSDGSPFSPKLIKHIKGDEKQRRRLKTNLNTWPRLVCFNVDGTTSLEGLQSCLVEHRISDNDRLRLINEDTISYVKKLCDRSKKNERNEHRLTVHLEDKMCLSRASNSMWRVMVNGTRKVHVMADKSDQKWRMLCCFGTGLGMWKNKLKFASCEIQNKAGSEVQGKRLLGSNALSQLVVWRSLKQNKTQGERQLTTPTLRVIYGELGACEVVWFATFLVLGACALFGSFFHFLPP